MADIAAANIDLKNRAVAGNMVIWVARVKGDGSGTTIVVPVGRIFAVLTQSIDDTTIPASSISHSGNTITYHTTPTNGTYHWLVVLGSE